MKFIGNVLPRTGHKPEGDATFDFTAEEARRMNLEGVPLRIEHSASFGGAKKVGQVEKCWDGPNGSKWIMGKIDDDEKGWQAKYARNGMKPDSRGYTLYPGLSLQHIHQAWPDGTTAKRPVEISICNQPRRPDCYIRAVSETGKNEYIAHKASGKYNMSSEQSTSQVTEQQAPVESTSTQEAVGNAPVESAPVEQASPQEQEARNVANSQEELMKMFLDQDSKNSELVKQLEEMKAAKEALEKKWAEKEQNEQIQTKSKAEALSNALIESWSEQLGPENLTEENKKAIFALANNHPNLAMPIMEVAHKASAKYATTRTALLQSEADSKKRVLEQQVVDTIMKRRRTTPAEVTTHAASIKSAPAPVANAKPAVLNDYNPFASATFKKAESTFATKNAHLFGALKGASQGNARSVMDSIAKYRGNL